MRTRLILGACALGVATLLVGACGDDDDDGGAAAEAVEIEGAWARPSPAMADAGAAYMTLTAPEDDALLEAKADASVAAEVQIHETVMAEGTTDTTMGGMSDTTMGGSGMTMPAAMEMREVDQIDLPAGEAVELKPGGYHIMLLQLAKPLETGQTIELTLVFDQAGEQTVSVPVRDSAP